MGVVTGEREWVAPGVTAVTGVVGVTPIVAAEGRSCGGSRDIKEGVDGGYVRVCGGGDDGNTPGLVNPSLVAVFLSVSASNPNSAKDEDVVSGTLPATPALMVLTVLLTISLLYTGVGTGVAELYVYDGVCVCSGMVPSWLGFVVWDNV